MTCTVLSVTSKVGQTSTCEVARCIGALGVHVAIMCLQRTLINVCTSNNHNNNNNNNNNNNHSNSNNTDGNVYSAVIRAEPLQEFTQFTL